MSNYHDDDLGPVGGIGSGNREYGGRPRITREKTSRHTRDTQTENATDVRIEKVFNNIEEQTSEQSLTAQQLAYRLRIWIRDEYDVFLSPEEALKEVQKRQAIKPKQGGDTGQ